jgi:hypothetical protein
LVIGFAIDMSVSFGKTSALFERVSAFSAKQVADMVRFAERREPTTGFNRCLAMVATRAEKIVVVERTIR